MKLSEKRLNVKSILIITVLLPVFVIIVSSAAIVITAKSVQPGSTLDMSLIEKTEKTLPGTNEEALQILTGLTESAVTGGRLKYSSETSVSISEISCAENDAVAKILSFASSSFQGKMAERYEKNEIKYGEDASALRDILPGRAPDENTYESENGRFTLTLTYNSVFNNMYFLSDDKTAVELFIKENESVFSAINKKFIPVKVEYILTGEEKSDEMLSLCISRTYNFSSNISFVNTLSQIGSMPLNMSLTFNEKYNFSYAGIKIEEDTVTFGEGDYDTLTVIPFTEANISEDEYSLSFISSDESVVTVDENGQITALKEHTEPVIITVELSYLGKTFTDSCRVFVVTPVETVKISDTEIFLKNGESHSLEATVLPDDATIKSIDFVSSDESIVKISSQGEITAVASGTATVYAYSVQGYIATECTVTVTD